MDIAADAVLDIAPATRAPNAARAPDGGSEFANHLESAHESDTAPAEAKPAQPHAQPQPEQAAPPAPEIIVQVIAAAPVQPQQPQPAAATNATPPAQAGAPIDAAALVPAPIAPAPPAAPDMAAVQAEAAAPQSAEAAPSTEKSGETAPAATPQSQTPNAAPIVAQAAPAPMQSQAAPAVLTPTAVVEVTAHVVTPPPAEVMVAAAQAAPAQPAPPRAPTIAPKAEIDTKAARTEAPATQATAPAPKAAPQAAKAPDLSTFLLSEAPEGAQATTPQHAASVSHVTAQAAQAASTEHGAARALPAAAQVAREIVRKFDGGSTRFELRLDPPELGRVDVRLEVSRDHRVSAVISADSPQALSELARHARDLEQQLQSAGIDLAENGLAFDLRQNSEGAPQHDADGAPPTDTETATAEEAPVTARPIGFERWRGVRVDVMA